MLREKKIFEPTVKKEIGDVYVFKNVFGMGIMFLAVFYMEKSIPKFSEFYLFSMTFFSNIIFQ